MLASEICWSGYYDLALSLSPKNPWKKKPVDHSLSALAERHLGIIIRDEKENENEKEKEKEGEKYSTENALECLAQKAAVWSEPLRADKKLSNANSWRETYEEDEAALRSRL